VSAVLGTILGFSGVKLVYNASGMNAADALYVPIIIAGFVLLFMGLKGLKRGFDTAVSESPQPPLKKKDENEFGPIASDSRATEDESSKES